MLQTSQDMKIPSEVVRRDIPGAYGACMLKIILAMELGNESPTPLSGSLVPL